MLLEQLRSCLRKAWISKAEAFLMHLFADGLRPEAERQLTLFEAASERVKAISALEKSANDRQGRFVLHSGASLPLNHIADDSANGYDNCDVRGKTCL